MKPYERYLIWAIVISLVTAGLVSLFMSPLSEWRRNPLFWLLLTGLYIAAIGMVLEWARHRHKKPLWLLMAIPVAVLAYETWFILKGVTASVLREPAMDWLILVWVMLTLYLWSRGNEYKKQLESAEESTLPTAKPLPALRSRDLIAQPNYENKALKKNLKN